MVGDGERWKQGDFSDFAMVSDGQRCHRLCYSFLRHSRESSEASGLTPNASAEFSKRTGSKTRHVDREWRGGDNLIPCQLTV